MCPVPTEPKVVPAAGCVGGCQCTQVEHLILYAAFTRTNGSERGSIVKKVWEPTSAEFKAVADWDKANSAGKGCIEVRPVTNLRSWVEAIVGGPSGSRPKASLKEVSLITHANSDDIGLTGTVDATTGNVLLGTSVQAQDDGVDVALNQSTGLDTGLVVGFGRGWFDIEDRGKPTAEKIKTKLAPGAYFNFYCCGVVGRITSAALYEKFAKVFGVTVRFLADRYIWYKPDAPTKTGVGKTAAEGTVPPTFAPGVIHNNGVMDKRA